MELRVFTEPQQGATYDDLLSVARVAEECGYGAFFRSDHYSPMGVEGSPGPTDAWITLAGLARDTSTIRLGTMMSSATFRLPGPFAISVAGVDQMSGGRVELGLGSGWFETEHTAYGIPFGDTKERFDRFEEQLAIITGLWSDADTFTHHGEHYSLTDAPTRPKPAQDRLPILIGGRGPKRTPRLAATYADEFNVPFASVADTAEQFERVRAACGDRGRDPESLIYSAAQVVCVGADESTIARRAGAIGREVDELRENGVAGTPDEAVARIEEFRAIGATRIYLQFLDLSDLDHVREVADTVMGRVGR